ncbi:MAG: 4Fe-4S cluster-binding domain-containing protein [Ruminococcaceae bacterium]|nr:4Fe-4S cluster-binding domain-containing protein [Oscillospiraceae bacterium]
MSKCAQCPRRCNAERTHRKLGFCGIADKLKIARAALHAWEEPPISGTRGSGTVFFSGCNLRCVFCQNHALSHDALGKEITEEDLANIFFRLRDEGAHNINLVTPTHHSLSLRRVLERVKPTLGIPVVWNSGGYEDPEILRTLEGLVDIYLPDIKYFSSDLSFTYSAARDYYTVALSALLEMLRQQPKMVFDGEGLLLRGTVVRHLVLPGCREDSIALLEALARDVGSDRFLISMMSQYTPDFALDCPHKNLHRRVTTFEYQSVLSRASELGFNGFSQARSSATAAFTPGFSGE